MWRSPDDGFYPHFDSADDFDARLARQVRERLDAGDRGVRVDVQNGVALLSGTVASTAMRRAALQAARSVPGVRDVCDAVHVLDDPGGAASGSAEPDVDRVFAEIITVIVAVTIAWRSPRRRRSLRTGTARWDRGDG